MEVITNKKGSFSEEYEAGDVFYQLSTDLYFILTEYEDQWQLISLDGDDGESYRKSEELRRSVMDWVDVCLTSHIRYPKADYQLILHKKGVD